MPLPQTNSPATNTDWLTPPEIIQALGEFDLDPCCPPVMPWMTARLMWTNAGNGFSAPLCPIKSDGLASSWYGRVWLNPPFRGAGEWVRKLREHGNGIAMLPGATDTSYFAENVWGHAHGVLFLSGRLRFLYPDGTKPKRNINRPCCLVAYGARNLAALIASGLRGSLVMEISR